LQSHQMGSNRSCRAMAELGSTIRYHRKFTWGCMTDGPGKPYDKKEPWQSLEMQGQVAQKGHLEMHDRRNRQEVRQRETSSNDLRSSEGYGNDPQGRLWPELHEPVLRCLVLVA
jgi:hypothetical protein